MPKYNPNEREARAMERALRQIRENAEHVAAEISTRGPAIHVAGAMLNDARSFKTYTRETGERTITVIVDFSGSMEKTWRHNGGFEFVLALVRLHRAGEIKVNLWLTEEDARAKVPVDTISDAELGRMNRFGGSEGLRATLKDPAVGADILDSSLTVIWTDGSIYDGDCPDVVRAYRSKGADIVGAAPRPDDTDADGASRQNILRHIGRGWVGDGITLARKIGEYVINRGH